MARLVDLDRVDRRLAVLGADDEQCGVVDAALLERLDHAAQGFIGLLEAKREHLGRRSGAVEIAADLAGMGALRATAVAVVVGELLPDADRLKIHSEHRGGTAGGRAVMHFQLIIGNRAIDADGGIEATHIGDFRGVEIVHALTRRTVDEIVGRMLVRPRSAATLALDYFEDGVGPDRIVRK